MSERTSLASGLCLVFVALSCHAGSARPQAASFSHHDWELSCDNTRTCRAAGYHSDDEEQAPVSVLLTRQAGPGTEVRASLRLGEYEEGNLPNAMPPVMKLLMQIDGRSLGEVPVALETLTGDLSQPQAQALVQALTRRSRIVWRLGEQRWHLSDKGAAAVLLKMDEFQGRVGTSGALIKKGLRDESRVLSPLPMPVVRAAAVPQPDEGRSPLSPQALSALNKQLPVGKDQCDWDEPNSDEPPRALTAVRLSPRKLLVSRLCWRAAYNEGHGYWVVNARPPHRPRLVTSSGTSYADGQISSQQKGRGLGDCWSQETWVWDGEDFVHTASSTSGMCKAIAPGGAWDLPVLVSDVRPAP